VVVRREAEQLKVEQGSVVLVCALGEFAVNDERLFQGDALVFFEASGSASLNVEPVSKGAVLIDARIVSKETKETRT
jgi:hypothetical protein